MSIEYWRAIPGYDGYNVSNYGRVKSLDRYVNNNCGKQLKKGVMLKMHERDGYYYVYLYINNKKFFTSTHRLVALAFLPNPNNYPEVNHKDENKSNNFVWVNPDGTIDEYKSNLEWCTREYNVNYGTAKQRKSQKMINGVRCRKVQQFDKDDNFIAEFISAREAAKHLGYNDPQIIRICCRGIHKTAGGYKWRYVNH